MFICLDLHAQGFYAMLSYVLCLFQFQVDVRVTCSYFCMMLLATLCSDLCVHALLPCFMIRSTSVHAYMLGFMFFHVYVLSFYVCFSTYMSMYMFSHVIVLGSMFSTLCYIPCACAIHAMFVCLDLGYICHAMCYCSPFIALSFFLMFWPNGQDPIQTLWSLSLPVHLVPHQRVWITPICMSMLARSYALCLCQPFQFKALPCLMPLAGLWLCGYV